MTNQKILEACRRAYSDFDNNDRGALAPYLSPDIVFDFPTSLPYGGTYRGLDEFQQYWTNLFENYFDSFTYDAHFILDAGSHVIVPVRAKASSKSGRQGEMENCILFTTVGGMITHARIYADTAVGRDLIAP
ncbi:MAG: nuclear transport factor 2 family protein [Sphingomonas sp.]|uniref:nuclear transport factor 2 family protein n=1 Tax=Sphingomonas sp. TaxID=28214 RepID=UPI00181C6EB2|nr:nuclear transport factor 2 family protein [Sphingomonas sp.]MBA3666656.1 nuclear transport factor 2 family protein [Sphingomonas sp.]